MLGIIGVLILIDQHKLETFGIFPAYFRMVFKQQVGIHQQIIKVHGIRLPATLHIAAIDIACSRNPSRSVRLIGFGIRRISIRQNQLILRTGDARLNQRRFISRFIVVLSRPTIPVRPSIRFLAFIQPHFSNN